jgi:hypothetical protein
MKSICIFCDTEYDREKSLGKLQCRFHPLEYNYDSDGKSFSRFHYDCCGASKNREDFEHYEHSFPKGCVRIDHVSSREELNALLSKPYAVIPHDKWESLSIPESHSYKVTKQSQLKPIRMAFVPDMTISINLLNEYNETFKEKPKTKGWDSYKKNGNAPTSYLYYYGSTQSSGEDVGEFKRFCVVRRIDVSYDSKRLREVSCTKSCNFF